ncbi:MAG TPA: amidohydrolase [Vicinamibacterales bacterium]|nr:amidohydrolase [Vicinamibacterales bacterium]
MRTLLVLASSLVAWALVGAQAGPDLVLVNGRVFTGVRSSPWVEALSISGELITATGNTGRIRSLATRRTRVIDVEGRLVVPGFNDAHTHPGTMPSGVTLEGPPAIERDPTFAEVLERLKAALAGAPAGGWIYGEIGSTVLDDPNATRFALDPIAPDRLVVLHAWTGHGTLVNTAVLRRLGIRDDEPDPPGGFYQRMPGAATLSGVAHEYAGYRLHQRIALEAPPEAQVEAFRRFAAEAAGFGITSVQAMMTATPVDRALELLAKEDLPIRMRLIDFPLVSPLEWQPAGKRGGTPAKVTVSGTKWVLDGTPVERLMWVREPYVDARTRGRPNMTASALTQFLARARTAGEQPMVHAVGDAAIDAVLDALERSGGEAWRSLRPRIEHGDLLEADQFQRAVKSGVTLVQNPSHFMIAALLRARLGEARAARVQAVKSSLAAGVPLAIGSDGPLNPFLNLMFATAHAANPSEALSLEQALVAYTHGSAYAERQEKTKGTLAAGMLADLAVLSQDVFQVPAETWPATTSVLTVVGGRIVHEVN